MANDVWQSSKYGTVLNRQALHSVLDSVLNITRVLWQSSEHAGVTQSSKYATIWLMMFE